METAKAPKTQTVATRIRATYTYTHTRTHTHAHTHAHMHTHTHTDTHTHTHTHTHKTNETNRKHLSHGRGEQIRIECKEFQQTQQRQLLALWKQEKNKTKQKL